MKDPWKVADRQPTPNHYLLGPEFPGCVGTFTRPCIFNLPGRVVPSTGQRYIVCYECDRQDAALMVVRGEARGKRVLKKREGWHGQVLVFKTRKPAVAAFESWCRKLAGEYAAMRDKARALRETVRTKPGTPDAIKAALDLGDMGL